MRVLAIDIGSSSVKAAILHGPGMPRAVAREAYATRYDGNEVDANPAAVFKAIRLATDALGPEVRRVDLIVPTGMAPSWLAMDSKGKALTPIVTHQDRRSLEQARRIEKTIGRRRHLKLTGNRPVPGAISSTTCAWFIENQRRLTNSIALIGHLSTWLTFQLCGARVIDPSNASFTGLFDTTTLQGWNAALIEAAGAKASWLPQVHDGNVIAGHLTAAGARRLGMQQGVPILSGVMDGSCAMLLAGSEAGRVVNVVGSTDVLAVCTVSARPHEGLLTRALGVGKRWLSVGTIAAAGTALDWAHRALFSELSKQQFYTLILKLSARRDSTGLTFDARLAGTRTEIEPTSGLLSDITIATTRDQILTALLDSLSRQSAERFHKFDKAKIAYQRNVFTTGGGNRELAGVLRRDWPGRWRFRSMNEATARGLWILAQDVRQ